MSFGSFIKNVVKHKLTAPEPAAYKTSAPLDLHQGSLVEFAPTDIVLAQSSGSLFKTDFELSQIVKAVGCFGLFNHKVTRGYLSDGVSFIEIATKDGETAHIRRDAIQEEMVITSPEEREFFIGKEPVYREEVVADDGEYEDVRNVEVSPREPALFGMREFYRGDQQEIIFSRMWGEGVEDAPLATATETIFDANGHRTSIDHNMMQYVRKLSTLTAELAYTDYQIDGEGEIVRVHVGFDIGKSSLNIIPA